MDVFRGQLSDISPRPDPFVVMVSSRDRALQASQRARGGAPRVGEGKNIAELRAEGLTVIDLSSLDDDPDRLAHSTFANSPTLIKMTRAGLLNVKGIAPRREQDIAADTVGESIGALSDLAAGIIYLPAKVVGVR
jgi:esterase/lipase superfamily enzyme